jgi:hypothetical protein
MGLRDGLNHNLSSVAEDPFVVGLLARLPAEVRETFTAEQLHLGIDKKVSAPCFPNKCAPGSFQLVRFVNSVRSGAPEKLKKFLKFGRSVNKDPAWTR